MNTAKKIAMVAAFLCAATVANAEGIKIGGKANYFVSQPTGEDAKEFDALSFVGVSVGVAFEIPLGPVTLNPGIEFFYSKPFVFTDKQDVTESLMTYTIETEISINEMGLSIPVIIQCPISAAYVGTGVQANIPLSSKTEIKASANVLGQNVKESMEIDNEERAAIDLGIAIVAGYNVSENISVGAKGVIGLTNMSKEGDEDAKYNQYGIGVTYFF